MDEFYSKIKLYSLHVQIIINSYCYNGTNKMTKEILLSLPKINLQKPMSMQKMRPVVAYACIIESCINLTVVQFSLVI